MNGFLRDLNPIEIQKYQANRYPWFFLDIITEVKPGSYAKGYKNFTYNEWFFPPHFADNPIVPGFILTESLVQVFIMSFLTMEGNEGAIATDLSSSSSRFLLEVKPGDRLDIEANLHSYHRGIAKGEAIGRVRDKVAVSANYVVAIPSVLKKFLPKA